MNDLKIKYNELFNEALIIDKKYNKEYSKRWGTIEILQNKIDNIEDKIYNIEDKIYKIKSEELESRHSKEELEKAKIILEDCGYTVVKI